MSMQQVNLYLPELRPKKEWLTANTVASSLLGFAFLMSASLYLISSNLKEYEAKIVLIEKQKEIIEIRVNHIQSSPHNINMVALEQTEKKLKKKVMAREQIGDLIQGQNLGNELGFSGAMLGFARQSFPSISLQHIRISRGGAFVELKGTTNIVENIPSFIGKLKNEPNFTESRFGLMSVVNAKNSSLHDFALGFDSVYQLAAQEDN